MIGAVGYEIDEMVIINTGTLVIDSQGNLAMKLGDALGVDSFAIRSSDDTDVVSADSLGNIRALGKLSLPGQAGQPASPLAGDIIFNTTTNKHQGYDGSVWNDLY